MNELFNAFDRLTAYRCRLRGVSYNDAACRLAWQTWCNALGFIPTNPFQNL